MARVIATVCSHRLVHATLQTPTRYGAYGPGWLTTVCRLSGRVDNRLHDPSRVVTCLRCVAALAHRKKEASR